MMDAAVVQSSTEDTPLSSNKLILSNPEKSLLLIEDDLSMIDFIDAVLDDVKPGLDWDYVTSGEEAIELILRKGSQSHSDPYSLVITDIFLEGEMTGFDVWLDCMQLYPEMPFVITSCLSFDRYFSILKGMTNTPVYLPKPLSAKRCQSVFQEYF